jgi:hypothetical protein
MTKLFLATPAMDGRLHIPYAISLAETFSLLASQGIETVIRIHSSGSLLVAERNRLLKAFIDSDCTHILCIDADMGWPAHALPAMFAHDVDFVGGCYPARGKNIFLFRPMYNEDKSLIIDKKLIKMESIPAGFLLIKRNVIEKLFNDHPELYYKSNDPEQEELDAYYLFQTNVRKQEFWGEDFEFCRLVREAGFDIWVDPLIEFDHAGTRGCLINCLTNDRSKARQ